MVMDKLKIGIVTYWDSVENYGQILQATALTIYLERLGHEPFIIRYKHEHASTQEETDWSKLMDFPLVARKIAALSKKVAIQPDRRFDEWKSDFLKYTQRVYDDRDIYENPPLADIYIAGSDQIWNHSYNGVSPVYFLDFVLEGRNKVAFAPSFGHANLPKEVLHNYKEWLANFDVLSVREQSGKELMRTMGFDDVPIMPDPALLISKEQWRQYADPIPFTDKPRVLIYSLGHRSGESVHLIKEQYQQDGSYQIDHISINDDFTGDMHASISEWLGHYAKADFVVSNSYHGILFALIFNKPFVALASVGDKADMNDRFETLLAPMSLTDRIHTSGSLMTVKELAIQPIDWNEVNTHLESLRADASAFLDQVLQASSRHAIDSHGSSFQK